MSRSNGALSYRCGDCGEIFPIPLTREWNEWPDTDGPPERWAEFVCPFCGSIEVDPYCEPEEDEDEE